MEVIEFESAQAITMINHDRPVKMIARATYEAEGDDKAQLIMNIEFPDIDDMTRTCSSAECSKPFEISTCSLRLRYE